MGEEGKKGKKSGNAGSKQQNQVGREIKITSLILAWRRGKGRRSGSG